MQSVGNLLQGKPGGGQQQLGALNAYIFDIVCQAGVHLPLEFLCQVVFGVAKRLASWSMGISSSACSSIYAQQSCICLDTSGLCGSGVPGVQNPRTSWWKARPAPCCPWHRWRAECSIAQRIAFLRGKAAFNGSTAAHRDEYNHRDPRLPQNFVGVNLDAVADAVGLIDHKGVVQIALAHHAQQRLLGCPDLMAVACGKLLLHINGSVILICNVVYVKVFFCTPVTQ